MSGLKKMKVKVFHGLALTLVFIFIWGCATTPYVAEPKELPPAQFSAQYPPTVRVRPANSEEAKNITQFPGKKNQPVTVLETVGEQVLLLAVGSPLLLFFWPEVISDGIEKYKEENKAKPALRKALEEFPADLQGAIERRFSVPSSGESTDLLEVVYFTGYIDYPIDDIDGCFVMHAQVTLQSKGVEVFRDIIRIDPRAYNSDLKDFAQAYDPEFQRPDCAPNQFEILRDAYDIIFKMIETRLPGLPWRSKEPKENIKQLDGSQPKGCATERTLKRPGNTQIKQTASR